MKTMLLKDFYTIDSLEQNDAQNHTAVISVNESHEVFKGHFPGNPIMPGVCMMQVIKEIAEKITGSALVMQSLSNVKFMALINPFATPLLRLELTVTQEGESVKVKNTTYFDQTVALKLSSAYKKMT